MADWLTDAEFKRVHAELCTLMSEREELFDSWRPRALRRGLSLQRHMQDYAGDRWTFRLEGVTSSVSTGRTDDESIPADVVESVTDVPS